MLHVSVLFCFTAFGAASGEFTLPTVCEPSRANNASGPKLPNLPTAFTTLIEVSIVKENYTAVYKESYDLKANKGRISERKNGTMHMDIYDYTLDEIIHIDDHHCFVSSASKIDDCHFIADFSFFGTGAHIESVTQLFKFGKEFNETFMGVSYVRGIRCHQWRACITTNFSSYHLDYYFSVPEWQTPWGMTPSTVVRAVVNGTSVNGNCNNGSWTVLNGTRDFYNVYDFIDFRPFPPDPSNFQIPDGVYCEGFIGANKTVPKIPPLFSMDFEWTSNRFNIVMSWQETHDVENKLAMFKHPDWWNPSFGPLTLIHDFNRGIGYNISRHHTGATCSLFNLTVKNWDVTLDESHHIRMKTAQELFYSSTLTNGSSPLMYKGSASVRGVNADIWVWKSTWKMRNKTRQVVDEWYFAKPSWRVESLDFGNIQHQVPLRRDFYSQDQSWHAVMSVFNFNPVAPDPTAFDIRPCFTREEQRLVWFSLNDPHGNYEKYVGSKDFIPSLAKAISGVANVTKLRLHGMLVVDNKKEELVVTFILLDRQKAIGAEVGFVYPEKDLIDALDALNNSVNAGNFKLKFGGETLSAMKSSFGVGFPTSVPSPPPPTPSSRPQPGKEKQNKGISSGAAAGIAITMLAVGIVGGLLIAHVIMKRRGTSLFQYQRQE